jgi:DNA primase
LGLVPDRSVRLRVLALPNAKDPDELIRSDPHAWPTLVRAALPVIDFVLQRLEARHDLSSAQGKAAAANEIAEVLAGIASPIEQDHYTNEVASRLKVDAGAVRRLLQAKHQRTSRSRPAATFSPQPSDVRGDTDDDYLLALLMRLREVPGAPPVVGPIDFVLSESRALFAALGSQIPEHLEPYADRARQRLAQVELLPTDKLLEGIELKQLEIRVKRLEAERGQVSTLLRDGAIDAEEAGLLLEKLRREMAEVAQQLPPERERAGIR